MEKELVSAFYDLSKELKQASPEQKIALVQCMLDIYKTAMCHLVIEEYDPKKKQNKGR